ncbi:2Fe-2S iron-sulfur cluster-binding protein [Streptomyces sp. NPDC004787]|uniref:2Fe-2S iron-sulfur cluster-binding protein n=1 Tax=Streptomyces sp. NPDC004787 TaxID=3154291 RepID=UPI0033BE3DA8
MSDAHEDAERGRTGGWEPIPQSEGYDGDATAFVQLPPEFMLEGTPLEAPGHGYVPPPMIVPLTPAAAGDPSATGTWAVQPPAPEQDPGYGAGYGAGTAAAADAAAGSTAHSVTDSVTDSVAAGHEAGYPPAPDLGATGQWTVPTVEDGADALEDSGEYTASRLAPYAGGAPATLPGGAPAPWADAFTEPEPEPKAGAAPAAGPGAGEPGVVTEPEAAGPVPADGAVPAPVPDLVPEPVPDAVPEQEEPLPPVALPTDLHADLHADLPADLPTDSSADSDEHPTISYALRVNGVDRPVTDSWIGESLLYVLRERLGLAGAKDGCSQGECGACNVQVDGRLVASCLVPAATAAGSEVRTVEGLAVDGEPSDVQRALAKCGVQCGFCIPGMAMTVHDLLEGNHAPTELETRQALCGNLCRCSGYRGVLDAVREIVAGRGPAPASGTGAGAPASGDGGDPAARIPHQIPHPHDGGTA